MTVGEAILMALDLGKRHSLGWTVIVDILVMVNKLYNKNTVADTKYKLFEQLACSGMYTYHVYCPTCEVNLGEYNGDDFKSVQCNECEKTYTKARAHYFIMLNFEDQLKHFFENPEVNENLNYRFIRKKVNEEAIEDVCDGEKYKIYMQDPELLGALWNISYAPNTDGAQAADSADTSIWPIYGMSPELPPHLRKKHMFLIGLWVDKKKPDMNLFLEPFVKIANKLSDEGVSWNLNGEEKISRCFPLTSCVDSAARHEMLNMKKFNAIFGCTFCEQEAEPIEQIAKTGKKIIYRRLTFSGCAAPTRTDESIRKYMDIADRTNKPQKGVRGSSVLRDLKHFDLGKGMIPDYMHSVLLGTTKRYTGIMTNKCLSRADLQTANDRLEAIRNPKNITRSPRSLNVQAKWKASEWRTFLIYYCLIVFQGLISNVYLNHLALLVYSVSILLQPSITPEMLNQAEYSLVLFVAQYQRLFGKSSITYNIHLLLHLCECVRNWGPLWAINCFYFEDANRILLKLKKSPYRVALDIARKYVIFNSLHSFSSKFPLGPRYQQFHTYLTVRKNKHVVQVGNITLLGSGKSYFLNLDEQICFGYDLHCKRFDKMIINSIRFTTASYNANGKTNDSAIILKNNKRGYIVNICLYEVEENDQIRKEVVIFYYELSVDEQPILTTSGMNIEHIVKYDPRNAVLRCTSAKNIYKQGFMIQIDNAFFFSEVLLSCTSD